MTEMTIGLMLFDDFQLLDVAGPLDVFAGTPGLRPLLVARTRDSVVPSALPSVRFTPDVDFDEAPALDVLFVPGGTGVSQAIVDPSTLKFLRERGALATYVTSVCTGAFVLGAAGLLNGYRAATHWRYMQLLPLVGAVPVDERVVRDRNRITSGGVTAGIDFGLALVAEMLGTSAAEATQLWMQYAPEPPFNAGHPSSAPQALVARLRESTQPSYDARATLLRAASVR